MTSLLEAARTGKEKRRLGRGDLTPMETCGLRLKKNTVPGMDQELLGT